MEDFAKYYVAIMATMWNVVKIPGFYRPHLLTDSVVLQNPSTTSHKPWPAPGKVEAEEAEAALLANTPHSGHPVPSSLSRSKWARQLMGQLRMLKLKSVRIIRFDMIRLDSCCEICGKLLASWQIRRWTKRPDQDIGRLRQPLSRAVSPQALKWI